MIGLKRLVRFTKDDGTVCYVGDGVLLTVETEASRDDAGRAGDVRTLTGIDFGSISVVVAEPIDVVAARLRYELRDPSLSPMTLVRGDSVAPADVRHTGAAGVRFPCLCGSDFGSAPALFEHAKACAALRIIPHEEKAAAEAGRVCETAGCEGAGTHGFGDGEWRCAKCARERVDGPSDSERTLRDALTAIVEQHEVSCIDCPGHQSGTVGALYRAGRLVLDAPRRVPTWARGEPGKPPAERNAETSAPVLPTRYPCLCGADFCCEAGLERHAAFCLRVAGEVEADMAIPLFLRVESASNIVDVAKDPHADGGEELLVVARFAGSSEGDVKIAAEVVRRWNSYHVHRRALRDVVLEAGELRQRMDGDGFGADLCDHVVALLNTIEAAYA